MSKVLEKHGAIHDYLSAFAFGSGLFEFSRQNTVVEYLDIDGRSYPKYINEFWTPKQRQANSLHEVAYRACFKPQLPRFFINLLTKPNDTVYDPFSGRGTTAIEAAILNRNVVANDINPLSRILTEPRLFVPEIASLEKRLEGILWLC
ncbi:MAG: DNA methyltransferase [Deltaproteobacteria bacterium]